jgi:hypothetical protein
MPLKFVRKLESVTGESPLRRNLRRAGLVLGVGGLGALCALAVSACGSSSAASGTTASTTTASGTTTTGSASFTAYQTCLKAHGVTFAASGFGGGFRRGATGASGATGAPPTAATGASGRGGFPRRNLTPKQQAAFTACASLRPTGGFGRGAGGPGNFANNPAFKKFQTCLKNHGVDTSQGGGFDGTSATGQAAFAACRSLLPQGDFGGGGFGGPGGGATGATGATGSGSSSSFQALQACLKAHGVQTGSASTQSPAKTAAAIATCQQQVLGGGSSTTTGG